MLKATPYGDVTRFDLARTLAGKGRYWTTAYLVDGWLIDTGCAFSAAELVHALAGVQLAGIVNTHSHEDHFGANGRFQAAHTGLPIRAHPLALPVLADPASQRLHPYRRLLWGRPEPSQGRPVADGEVIATGRYRFRVVYTPGHGLDHICLVEPEQGWLFTGDLFVGGRDRALREGYDIWAIIASLKRVAALPVARLFPGSARVRDNAAAEIAAKIDHYEALGERVLGLHRQGRSVDQIVRALLGGPMPIEAITLGHFSRRWLVRSYLEAGDHDSPCHAERV